MPVWGQLQADYGSTLISLVIDRIRLLESSDSKIMPSMLLYSRRWTYAPISAIDFTCNTSPMCGEVTGTQREQRRS